MNRAQAVRVFDPPMCCSTGICGPSVDPKLVRFAADLNWLEVKGVVVDRFNLSQQPAAFVAAPAVKAELERLGDEALPIIEVDGTIVSVGTYPTREELAAWTHVEVPEASPFLTRPAPTRCC